MLGSIENLSLLNNPIRPWSGRVVQERKAPNEEGVRLKEEILSRIDYWHTTMPYISARKLATKLRAEGYVIGRKRARTYMQEMGIHAVYPKPNLFKCNSKDAITPNLLRNKSVCFPNQVWSIDITYIKMQHSHMYLTAIIDWFNRKIMGGTVRYARNRVGSGCSSIGRGIFRRSGHSEL